MKNFSQEVQQIHLLSPLYDLFAIAFELWVNWIWF